MTAWEAAALEAARRDELVPWPMVPLTLRDDAGHEAIVQVASDVLAVGTIEDHVRLPLLPSSAQNILNLSGALLPTPWLEYQIWRAAPAKIRPIRMNPNPGANLSAYARHDAMIDEELAQLGRSPDQIASGMKKAIVVSKEMKSGRVVIFGWYEPDGPDVFDQKGVPMNTEGRQPIQPLSNLHAATYVDYSHGARAVGPECVVDGRKMSTSELYRHPTLSRLVSNEGPVLALRYPSTVVPARNIPPPILSESVVRSAVADVPGPSEVGFDVITRKI